MQGVRARGVAARTGDEVVILVEHLDGVVGVRGQRHRALGGRQQRRRAFQRQPQLVRNLRRALLQWLAVGAALPERNVELWGV